MDLLVCMPMITGSATARLLNLITRRSKFTLIHKRIQGRMVVLLFTCAWNVIEAVLL